MRCCIFYVEDLVRQKRKELCGSFICLENFILCFSPSALLSTEGLASYSPSGDTVDAPLPEIPLSEPHDHGARSATAELCVFDLCLR